jgi:hypothetical protein
VIVNLAELSGKEKAISDAYLSNVLDYNSPDVVYISFDFHEYWYTIDLYKVSCSSTCLVNASNVSFEPARINIAIK